MADNPRGYRCQTQSASGTYGPHEMMGLITAVQAATDEHLFAAADYMARFLTSHAIPYALMSGFSLRLRGSTRLTRDVDIAVGCNMGQLLPVLRSQTRIRRPAGPTSGVTKIFVTVGGDFNPGLQERLVEVDLILQGSLGAPDDLSTASERIEATSFIGSESLKYTDRHQTEIVLPYESNGGWNIYQQT